MLLLGGLDDGSELSEWVRRDSPEWEAMRDRTIQEHLAAKSKYETERDRVILQLQHSDLQFITQMFHTELKAEIHKEYDVWGTKWRQAGQQVIDKYVTLEGCDPQYATMLSRLSSELPAVQNSSKLHLTAITAKFEKYRALIQGQLVEAQRKAGVVSARQATGKTPPFDTKGIVGSGNFVETKKFPFVKSAQVRSEWLTLQQVLEIVAEQARKEYATD